MDFWAYGCSYVRSWRKRIESKVTNGRKADIFMVEEREEMKGTHQWSERNVSSLDTSVKMALMNKTTEILMEEHNRIKGLVNS